MEECEEDEEEERGGQGDGPRDFSNRREVYCWPRGDADIICAARREAVAFRLSTDSPLAIAEIMACRATGWANCTAAAFGWPSPHSLSPRALFGRSASAGCCCPILSPKTLASSASTPLAPFGCHRRAEFVCGCGTKLVAAALGRGSSCSSTRPRANAKNRKAEAAAQNAVAPHQWGQRASGGRLCH